MSIRTDVPDGAPPAEQATDAVAAAPLREWRCLSIDVEPDVSDAQRVFTLGACRSDNASSVSRAVGCDASAPASEVDALVLGAGVVVGHNVRRHDLPELARQIPGLALTGLPAIDTLEWSALALPTNPYHRLIKGYKLVSDARNDPLRDARLALELLADGSTRSPRCTARTQAGSRRCTTSSPTTRRWPAACGIREGGPSRRERRPASGAARLCRALLPGRARGAPG